MPPTLVKSGLRRSERIRLPARSSRSVLRDLALSAFCPFRAIKGKLAGSEFGRTEEAVAVVTDITCFISRITLVNFFAEVISFISVSYWMVFFPEWEQSLQKYIDMEGDYPDRSAR
jgi:hypothetical protein